MSDLNLIGWLTANLTTYGPVTVGLVLLLAAMGTPLPSSLLVVATGAFVRQGLIDGATAAALGLLGAVAGDVASYAIGRTSGQKVQGLQAGSGVWGKARTTFARAGGPAIYLRAGRSRPWPCPST